MKYHRFVANRLLKGSQGQNLSNPFIRITTVAVALSLTVMIVTVAIITGFKREIKSKVYGFGGHIQIANYDSNLSYEAVPIRADLPCFDSLKTIPGVKHVQQFITKAAILKTDNDIQGVVLKGVANDFDWKFFANCLIDGAGFEINDSVSTNNSLISNTLATLLNLKVGDTYDVFFVQNPPRYRRFKVTGIYNTHLVEFDKMFLLCDIKHLQKLNGWQSNQISGLEIFVDDVKNIDRCALQIDNLVGVRFFDDYSMVRVMTISEKYPNIFDWVNLQNLNAAVLIVLMLVVAGINMISGLLIIILEKTRTIGLLKALGANNSGVRRIFMIQAAKIMLRGLIIGNICGIGLCLVQQFTGLIKLDEAYYYLSQVPICLEVWHIVLLNVVAFVVGLAMLAFPSMVVASISPDKTLKFD